MVEQAVLERGLGHHLLCLFVGGLSITVRGPKEDDDAATTSEHSVQDRLQLETTSAKVGYFSYLQPKHPHFVRVGLRYTLQTINNNTI